jgi:hypothetical protein
MAGFRPSSLARCGAAGLLLIVALGVCLSRAIAAEPPISQPHRQLSADERSLYTAKRPAGASEHRDYVEGPLTADDYLAAVPADRGGLQAMTTADLRVDFHYELEGTKRRLTARLTSINVRAVVIPAKSWNLKPDDPRLLDHEQGHFDLAHIMALRARLHFAREEPMTGKGPTRNQAIADLNRNVERQFRRFVDELQTEQTRYDELTRHGAVRRVQEHHRRQHREQIELLTEALREQGREG